MPAGEMSVAPEQATEQAATEPAALTLAGFYDRRAPAALAYCARVCPPEAVAGAVEASFGRALADGLPGDRDELDARLRSALRAEAADRCVPQDEEGDRRRFVRDSVCARTPRLLVARAAGELSDAELEALGRHLYTCADCRALEHRFDEAERTFDALAGDDAPALGRSLVAELIDRLPAEPTAPPPPAPGTAVKLPPPAAALPPPPPPPPRGDVLGRTLASLPKLGHVGRRRLAVVLFVAGVLLLAEVLVTTLWKEPFTAYVTAGAQADLSKQLDRINRTQPAGAVPALARRLDQTTPQGNALGRLQIPRIGIDFVVVQGTDGASLRKGPGHYSNLALPGEGETVGIAGHRTTYEAPFRNIDQLRPGDPIYLRMPYGLFTYRVQYRRIVATDARVFGPAGYERLVLSACHPLFSGSRRIVVFARLAASRPLNAAAGSPLAAGARLRALGRARLAALGTRTLQAGARGSDVRELQRLLGLPPSGYFGADTVAAVIAFQRSHRLQPNGTVDARTKQSLARRPRLPSLPPTPAAVAPAKPSPPPASGQGSGSTGTQTGTQTTPQGGGAGR